MAGVFGEPTYDTAGMSLVGHPVSTEVVAFSGTSAPSVGILTAGVMYRLWSKNDFYYILGDYGEVTPVATANDVGVGARIPEYVIPRWDCKLAVIQDDDSGNLHITLMSKYGE